MAEKDTRSPQQKAADTRKANAEAEESGDTQVSTAEAPLATTQAASITTDRVLSQGDADREFSETGRVPTGYVFDGWSLSKQADRDEESDEG